MNHVVRIHQPGAPSVLQYEEATDPLPGPGQVRLRQEAVGVNFVDTLFRSGAIKIPTPFIPGGEGAGVVDKVGDGVTALKEGDRVAYYFTLGAYAATRLMNPADLVTVPADISFEQAAAVMAKGLTAWSLIRKVHVLARDEYVLVHAAAGGVGTLVSRWAKALGATVVATVGSEDKLEAVRRGGIDHVFTVGQKDVAAAIADLTSGRGVDVVYDGVGQSTAALSLAAVRDGGAIVRFGSSSGGAPPVDPTVVETRRLKITSPRTAESLPTHAVLEAAAAELFSAIRTGVFGELPITKFPLSQAARAHEDLQARRTTGSVVLIP